MNNEHKSKAHRAWEIIRPFVNATMVLAIILMGAMIWLISSTQAFVDDTMDGVKFGIVEELDNDAKLLIEELRKGEAEFEAFRGQVASIVAHPDNLIDPEIRRSLMAVEADANRIANDLGRIANGHIDLSQETLEKLAISLVHAYGKIRGCNLKGDGAKPVVTSTSVLSR